MIRAPGAAAVSNFIRSRPWGIMEKKWYIVHTYSGYEQKVKLSLEENVRIAGKEDYFGEVLVPTEKVVDMVKE